MYRLYGYVINSDKFITQHPMQTGSLRDIIMSLSDNVTSMVLQHVGKETAMWQAVIMSYILIAAGEPAKVEIWPNHAPLFPIPEAAVACLMMAHPATVLSGTTKSSIIGAEATAREKRQAVDYIEAFDRLTKHTDFDTAFNVFNKLSIKHQKE